MGLSLSDFPAHDVSSDLVLLSDQQAMEKELREQFEVRHFHTSIHCGVAIFNKTLWCLYVYHVGCYSLVKSIMLFLYSDHTTHTLTLAYNTPLMFNTAQAKNQDLQAEASLLQEERQNAELDNVKYVAHYIPQWPCLLWHWPFDVYYSCKVW